MTEHSAKDVVLKDASGVYLIPLGSDVRFDELNGYWKEAIDGNLNIDLEELDGNVTLETTVDGNIGMYKLWEYLNILASRIAALEIK